MKTVRTLIVPVLLLSAAAVPATEIIPFAGYRFGETVIENNTGDLLKMEETSSLGFMLAVDRDTTSTYDFHFSTQDTSIKPSVLPRIDLRIDYFHIGGTRYYPGENLTPFVAGGFGITRVVPDGSTYADETDLSLSIGGGVRVPLTNRIGLRLEGRAYGTFVDGSGSVLCANGACAIAFSGNLYVQIEALAGVVFSF